MTVVNQKRNVKDRDSSKQKADHHAKMSPSTGWLMTILQTKNTTVGIVATCSRRGPDLEPSISAEIAYYTHGSLITQNCRWKYLLRPTTSKIAITHHHQLLLQETTGPHWLPVDPCSDPQVPPPRRPRRSAPGLWAKMSIPARAEHSVLVLWLKQN